MTAARVLNAADHIDHYDFITEQTLNFNKCLMSLLGISAVCRQTNEDGKYFETLDSYKNCIIVQVYYWLHRETQRLLKFRYENNLNRLSTRHEKHK